MADRTFLVFSEWGNMQLSWVIVEVLKNYITMQYPSFALNEQLSFSHNGHSYTLFMPEWEGLGQLIQPLEGCEPIYFKDETGELWVLLTGNNTYREIKPLTQKKLRSISVGPASEAKPTQGGQNRNRERIGKSYLTHFYNLDAILSDGYSANRANSVNTTAFRRWSTRICQT